jgi:1,4-alpha-glucan branching enzyme
MDCIAGGKLPAAPGGNNAFCASQLLLSNLPPAPVQKLGTLNQEQNMATPQTIMSKQAFAIRAPSALSVQLVGDFTHWQKSPVQMRKEAGGLWRATVELAPGLHHYRFLVDGEWRDDPENTLRVPNPFGSHNAVCKVA